MTTNQRYAYPKELKTMRNGASALTILGVLFVAGTAAGQTICQDDSNCTDPNYPKCYQHQCVECIIDSDCPGYDDWCDGVEVCISNECLDTPAADAPCNAGTGGCEDGCDEVNDVCTCQNDCDCDDGLYCNGEEQCVTGVCQPGTPPHPYQFCDEVNDQAATGSCMITFITASDADGLDKLGTSVAIDGVYAVLGAPTNSDGNEPFRSGSAYVLFNDIQGNDNWIEKQEIKPDEEQQHAYQYFGHSVSISGDYLVVGAREDNAEEIDGGAGYVFKRNTQTDVWEQEQQITAGQDAFDDDEFGTSVAIDGDFVVVGAPLDDDDGASSGSAYVFQRSGQVWTRIAKLTANDAAAGDEFGISVAISGVYILVGARLDDHGDPAELTDAGSAYVFERSGEDWTQIAKLTGDDPDDGGRFGSSVSIDGEYAVVGSPNRGVPFAQNTGAAYVFLKDTGGIDNWGEQAELLACDSEQSDEFGASVSIKGPRILIGVPMARVPGMGATRGRAYAFKRSGTDWNLRGRLSHPVPDLFDRYGYAVAVSDDHYLIGVKDDDQGDVGAGGAFLYGVDCPYIMHMDPKDVRNIPFEDHAFSGYIDPKVESDDGEEVNLGLTTFTIIFSEKVFNEGGAALTKEAFVVRDTGIGDPPTVSSIISAEPDICGEHEVTVTLSGIITLQEWTTIEANVQNIDEVHIGDFGDLGERQEEPDRIDVAFLPGDVNNDGKTQPLDLSRWLSYYSTGDIPGAPSDPHIIHGTTADYLDISRDGNVEPLDLSRMIAALQGSSPFTQVWNGMSMLHTQP